MMEYIFRDDLLLLLWMSIRRTTGRMRQVDPGKAGGHGSSFPVFAIIIFHPNTD